MTGTVIQLKKSATPSAQPGSLANGEIAINYADGKLFYKDSSGSIQQISSGGNSYSTINVAGSLIVADMGSDILTINKGENIELSTDIVNDTFTIAANLKPAFDMANLAWELANTANSKSGGGSASVSTSDSAPLSPIDGDLWWNSLVGKLFVYYDDSSSSQWVEASGGLLYSAEAIATSAWNTANAAFNRANTSNDVLFVVSAYDTANGAFDKANAANVLAYNTGIGANAYSDSSLVTGREYTNTSTLSSNNYAGLMANSVNSYTSATYATIVNTSAAFDHSNTTYIAVNSAFGVINSSYTVANAGFDKANAANVLAYDTGIGANAYSVSVGASGNAYVNLSTDAANAYSIVVGAASNAYTNTVGTSANNYAGVMANSSNIFTGLVYTAVNSAFGVINAAYTSSNADYVVTNASFTVANAAFGFANSSNTWVNSTFIKLTAPSQTITGDLTITGNIVFGGNATSITSNNLVVNDSLIYLANNNPADILDIGFIGSYINATSANAHTGLFRDHNTKQYYLFQGYDADPERVNDIVPYSNNMVNSVLIADFNTSNLTLGGANAIVWIKSAFDTVNAAYTSSNADYTLTNAAFTVANAGFDKANAAFAHSNNVAVSANTYAEFVGSSINAYIGLVYSQLNITSNIVNSSYNFANSVSSNSSAAFNSTNSVYSIVNTVFSLSNTAFNKANSANILAYNTGIGANVYADSLLITSRGYSNISTTAANNYAGVMANSSNAYTTATYATIITVSTNATSANNYAGVMANGAGTIANSAFGAANQAGTVANNTNTYVNSTYVKKVGDTITGDLVIQGNVTISGATTYTNTQTLLIGDNIITLNNDLPNAVAPSQDAGIEIKRGTLANVSILWNEASDKWTFTNDGTNYKSFASNTDVESANNYSGAMANSANAWSNTKLANTNVVLAGNLTSTQGMADRVGDLRNLPIVNQTSSYILSLADNGEVISITTGNVFVTAGVFFPGNTVSVFNNSSANITITQNTSVTLYSAGTANTGNRILQQRGIATLVCVATDTFVITGAGVVP